MPLRILIILSLLLSGLTAFTTASAAPASSGCGESACPCCPVDACPCVMPTDGPIDPAIPTPAVPVLRSIDPLSLPPARLTIVAAASIEPPAFPADETLSIAAAPARTSLCIWTT